MKLYIWVSVFRNEENLFGFFLVEKKSMNQCKKKREEREKNRLSHTKQNKTTQTHNGLNNTKASFFSFCYGLFLYISPPPPFTGRNNNNNKTI